MAALEKNGTQLSATLAQKPTGKDRLQRSHPDSPRRPGQFPVQVYEENIVQTQLATIEAATPIRNDSTRSNQT